MPGEYAAHRAPAGSRRLEGDRPLRHRLAGRRDLRQGRRARAGRVPAAGRVQGPLRRQEGPHAVGAVRGLRRPRRADHGQGQALPVPDASPRSARRAPRSRPTPARSRRSRSSRSSTAPPATGGLLPGGNLPLPATPSVPGAPSLPGSPSLPAPPSLPGGLGLPELGPLPKAMSNALLVSGANSASGHPLAVFGPQVAYFAPQILMEEDLHGPGIDAKGAAFPGVNLYVQLGHGRDYAWSATSAGQDIIDTFAVPLCDATHYRFRGQCLADRGARAQERLDAEPGRPDAGRRGDAARRAHEARPRRRPRHLQGQADALHGAALDLPARGRLGHRLQPVQRARHHPLATGLPARGRQRSATRSTGSTSTPSTSPTSTPATTRCGRRGRPASCRWHRPRSGATSTRTSTPRATRRSPSTRRSSTSRSSRAGTTARRPATPAPTRTSSARSSARRCSIASWRCGSRAATSSRCPRWSTRWSRPAPPTCAA